jgi:NAD-dependent deacetylase
MHPPVGNCELDEALERAASLLRAAQRVAVLTGAGISAESGLATFRGAGGLWEGHRVEDVATPRAFERDPVLVWRFYNLRRGNLRSVQPNPGHLALVELEKRFSVSTTEAGKAAGPAARSFTLVTQNVDGLHQAAGSQNVYEIHGTIRRVRCCQCDFAEDRGTETLPDLPRCPQCGGRLRPDVVWFEEALPPGVWARSELAVKRCQVFLVVGTSAVVYPAAGLIGTARSWDARIIEVNLAATDASSLADVVLQGPSGTILPKLVRRL